MKIKNHKFVDHFYKLSKDMGGLMVDPKFIVMHYTAGGSGVRSRNYMLKSPTEKGKLIGSPGRAYASAHIVIDRDGSVWQIVPFNRQARHAGRSNWQGIKSLNRCSIGIEIANYGWLNPQGDGSYRRSDTPKFKSKDVTIGPMPGTTNEIKGWENYTKAQLETLEAVTLSLIHHYPSIIEVVGHQEISPKRKFDPGPAFPMQSFRNLFDHRGIGAVDEKEEPALPENYITTTRLNVRGGPGTKYEKMDFGPLKAKTKLKKLDQEGNWYFVGVANKPTQQGWVYNRYVKLV